MDMPLESLRAIAECLRKIEAPFKEQGDPKGLWWGAAALGVEEAADEIARLTADNVDLTIANNELTRERDQIAAICASWDADAINDYEALTTIEVVLDRAATSNEQRELPEEDAMEAAANVGAGHPGVRRRGEQRATPAPAICVRCGKPAVGVCEESTSRLKFHELSDEK